MKNQAFIHVPNSIYNFNLSPSELMCYCTLLSLKNKTNRSSATFNTLSRISGISIATVSRALRTLCLKGLIVLHKQHYYDGNNRANGYTVANLCSKGFFRIPRHVITACCLAPSAFALYAALCKCAGKSGTAFPSLATLSAITSLSVKTIIKHVDTLVAVKLLRKANYIRLDGSFGHNQYSITGISCTHHKHTELKCKKTTVLLSCWHSNRLDMVMQYSFLKCIQTTACDELEPQSTVMPLSYHHRRPVSMGTVILSKQYLYSSSNYKRERYSSRVSTS